MLGGFAGSSSSARWRPAARAAGSRSACIVFGLMLRSAGRRARRVRPRAHRLPAAAPPRRSPAGVSDQRHRRLAVRDQPGGQGVRPPERQRARTCILPARAVPRLRRAGPHPDRADLRRRHRDADRPRPARQRDPARARPSGPWRRTPTPPSLMGVNVDTRHRADLHRRRLAGGAAGFLYAQVFNAQFNMGFIPGSRHSPPPCSAASATSAVPCSEACCSAWSRRTGVTSWEPATSTSWRSSCSCWSCSSVLRACSASGWGGRHEPRQPVASATRARRAGYVSSGGPPRPTAAGSSPACCRAAARDRHRPGRQRRPSAAGISWSLTHRGLFLRARRRGASASVWWPARTLAPSAAAPDAGERRHRPRAGSRGGRGRCCACCCSASHLVSAHHLRLRAAVAGQRRRRSTRCSAWG